MVSSLYNIGCDDVLWLIITAVNMLMQILGWPLQCNPDRDINHAVNPAHKK